LPVSNGSWRRCNRKTARSIISSYQHWKISPVVIGKQKGQRKYMVKEGNRTVLYQAEVFAITVEGGPRK
jgi:hypothetical protein